MSKRKLSLPEKFSNKKLFYDPKNQKKHTLDSDEEDDVDENEGILDADDIEGEEDGISRQTDDGVRMTAFNMKEEMEEGHFDKQGHFIWKNEQEIRDNWLDNIDWHKVNKDDAAKYNLEIDNDDDDDDSNKGLGDEDDSSDDNEMNEQFNEIEIYEKMLHLMKPHETVNKAIKRLGGDTSKLSSIERLKRKKAGTLNTNEDVIKLTEYANEILTKTGNMDIYQETYEQILNKIENKKKKNEEPALDMYADDFETKEQQIIGNKKDDNDDDDNNDDKKVEVRWEFKWDQNKDDIEGPYDTRQMIKWSKEGYFKTGVWVRKCGEQGQFYTSNRIDFELYE